MRRSGRDQPSRLRSRSRRSRRAGLERDDRGGCLYVYSAKNICQGATGSSRISILDILTKFICFDQEILRFIREFLVSLQKFVGCSLDCLCVETPRQRKGIEGCRGFLGGLDFRRGCLDVAPECLDSLMPCFDMDSGQGFGACPWERWRPAGLGLPGVSPRTRWRSSGLGRPPSSSRGRPCRRSDGASSGLRSGLDPD
jgi:hypothetical protein